MTTCDWCGRERDDLIRREDIEVCADCARVPRATILTELTETEYADPWDIAVSFGPDTDDDTVRSLFSRIATYEYIVQVTTETGSKHDLRVGRVDADEKGIRFTGLLYDAETDTLAEEETTLIGRGVKIY